MTDYKTPECPSVRANMTNPDYVEDGFITLMGRIISSGPKPQYFIYASFMSYIHTTKGTIK
jgi:hypothetical protein